MTEEIDPRIARIIWKSLGVKSVREIAEETGLTPEEIFAVKRELFESIDTITVLEKRQKLLVMLEEIAHTTKEDYANAPFQFKSGLMNSAISAMKTIMVELARASKQDQAAVESLNALRVRELVTIVQESVNTSVPEISDEYDIPEQALFDIFNKNLGKAALKREVEG